MLVSPNKILEIDVTPYSGKYVLRAKIVTFSFLGYKRTETMTIYCSELHKIYGCPFKIFKIETFKEAINLRDYILSGYIFLDLMLSKSDTLYLMIEPIEY